MLMSSGSAPLSPAVGYLLRRAFGAPLVEGYGLTETTAAATAQRAHVSRDGKHLEYTGTYGHAGQPLPCCAIKLVSVPDMGYTTEDQPCPRGEIWISGPNVFKGYYKQPELTYYPAVRRTGAGEEADRDVGCDAGTTGRR